MGAASEDQCLTSHSDANAGPRSTFLSGTGRPPDDKANYNFPDSASSINSCTKQIAGRVLERHDGAGLVSFIMPVQWYPKATVPREPGKNYLKARIELS